MAESASNDPNLLASGGGNATSAGVTMQASVAASISVQIIRGISLDPRLGLGAAKPVSIRLETEVPVDDILIETDKGGWIFVQAKNSLRNGTTLRTELGKTCDEFARLWLIAQNGSGTYDWDRPLAGGKHAMLLAVGPMSSGTIKYDLPKALDAVRMQSTATLAAAQRTALTSFRTLLKNAFEARGGPEDLDVDTVLKFIHVLDFDPAGALREVAEARLGYALDLPETAPAAFRVIERECQNAMTARGRLDASRICGALDAAGTPIKARNESLLETQIAIRGAQQEILAGQRDILRTFSDTSSGSHIVTREAESILRRVRQSRFAVGFNPAKETGSLMGAVERGELAAASPAVRQSIYAWCARILTMTDLDGARRALEKAEQIGTSDETVIARAFLQAYTPGGDRAAAVASLEPLATPESLAASLMIAAHNVPVSVGLGWWQSTGFPLERLHPDGKLRILGLQLTAGDWAGALSTANALTESDFREAPALFFLAATASLGQAIHADFRDTLQLPLPQQLTEFPLQDDAGSMGHRAKAINLYKRAASEFTALGAAKAAALASDRALWLELRDPATRAPALEELQKSMADEKVRLRRVPLAVAFGLKLKIEAIERDIERAQALTGGQSSEAVVARLVVALMRKGPEVADYIEAHREQLIKYYTPGYVDSLAIETLAKVGRTEEARDKLTQSTETIADENVIATLQSLIEEAEGADPVARRETEYAVTSSVQSLIHLVDELERARDFPRIAQYGERQFQELRTVDRARSYVAALSEIAADDRIERFAEENPEMVQASQDVKTAVSWAYYRLGRLSDAKALLAELRAGRDVANDRFLSINIAIASGDWSALSTFVESEWEHRNEREPMELLRAGALAQRIGSAPRSKELIREAARRADGDPHVLAGAYEQASSAGWEDDADIHEWLSTAIEKSGEDGPIQRIDVRELLDGQPRWNERIDRTWSLLLAGEAPMFIAAQAAKRTLLDLTLRPALQNLKRADPRKRGLIFSFAGNRRIGRLPGKRVALDITSLLSLGLTRFLRKAIEWSASVRISHTTLTWLFEERAKLAFHQPSQVKRAREVKRLMDAGAVHRFEGTAPPPALEFEVGDDIARFLVAAQTLDPQDKAQRIVVRPYPLFRPGSLLEEQADIGGFEEHIAGCTDVIEGLRAGGQLTELERRNALDFLRIHETPWPHNPCIQHGATLYIDDLALSYFQHLKLLPKLAQAGYKVFVSSSEADRADELMDYDEAGAEVHAVLEEIQHTIRDGIVSGKVTLGPLMPGDVADDNEEMHPSRLAIAMASDADAYVVDDRFVNKFPMTNETATVTSIDLLFTMAEDGAISPEQLTEAMTVLRQSGALLVPHSDGEIESLLRAAQVVNGELQETSELRAIRESVIRVRMTDVVQLPNEAEWIDTLTRQLLAALRAQWNDTVSDEKARACSNWVLKLLDARGWAHRSATISMDAVERYRAQVLTLSMLPSGEPAVRERYWKWLEKFVVEEFKDEEPNSYAALLASVRDTINRQVAQTLPEGNPDTSQFDERAALALKLLKLFPPSVGADALEDAAFRERYGLKFDATVTFNGPAVAVKRSKLYSAIRTLFANNESSATLETIDSRSVELTVENHETEPPKLFISIGDGRHELPSFGMLADGEDIRSAFIQSEIAVQNLPPETIENWTQKLQDHALNDDEIDELLQDLRSTPQVVSATIRQEFEKEEGTVSALIPRSRNYYRGLIGDRGEAKTIEEYAAGNARAQVMRLLAWNFQRGLSQCLLFCANPRMSALIDISGRPADEIEKFYSWLAKEADRFSQIAGIEVGVRALAEYPQLEPILLNILEEIRDEDTSSSSTRLALTTNLFVFVDGELARTAVFADEPPFWRRLAATAQASMIEGALVTVGAAGDDWSDWGGLRGEQFFMQTLVDLREEPRWIPDLMSAKQLRLELLMRARIVGEEARASLPEGPLREFLLGKELVALTSTPSAYAPSPVEGGIESPRPFPVELLTDLRNARSDITLEERSLASVVNFSQVFRFDQEIAGSIAELLRTVKYRVSLRPESEITFTILMGLASIAASARHPGLADEIRVLTRVLTRRGELSGDFESCLRIALLACASREDKGDWCKAVGDWLFEIANGELDREEAARFRCYLRRFFHAAPDLWAHAAKVDATLAAISG